MLALMKIIHRGGAQGTSGTARPTGLMQGPGERMKKPFDAIHHHDINHHRGTIRSGAAATTGTARAGGFQNPANINHTERFKDVFEHFGKLPK